MTFVVPNASAVVPFFILHEDATEAVLLALTGIGVKLVDVPPVVVSHLANLIRK